MARRRRNKLVLWEWSSGDRKSDDARRRPRDAREVPEAMKRFALIAVGLGFLYFAWLFSTTGIFVANRSRITVTADDDPSRFSLAVGLTAVIGAVILIKGIVALMRR